MVWTNLNEQIIEQIEQKSEPFSETTDKTHDCKRRYKKRQLKISGKTSCRPYDISHALKAIHWLHRKPFKVISGEPRSFDDARTWT